MKKTCVFLLGIFSFCDLVLAENYSFRVVDNVTKKPIAGLTVQNVTYPDRTCKTDKNGKGSKCTQSDLEGGLVEFWSNKYFGLNVELPAGNSAKIVLDPMYVFRVVDKDTGHSIAGAEIQNKQYPERSCVTDSDGAGIASLEEDNNNCNGHVLSGSSRKGSTVIVSAEGYYPLELNLTSSKYSVIELEPAYKVRVVDDETGLPLSTAHVANADNLNAVCVAYDGIANCSKKVFESGRIEVSYMGYETAIVPVDINQRVDGFVAEVRLKEGNNLMGDLSQTGNSECKDYFNNNKQDIISRHSNFEHAEILSGSITPETPVQKCVIEKCEHGWVPVNNNGLWNCRDIRFEQIDKWVHDVDLTKNKWKDVSGKFNTARLTSDLTAGVVLGTVGGVVSGVVIKKKQVEKGFDALSCYVGGQKMADWGDEFRVVFTR